MAPTAFAKSDVFAVFADTHVRFQGDDILIKNNMDTLRAFKWAKGLSGLDGVLVAGDIADRGFNGDFVAYDMLWKRAKINVPRIQCMGNHDTNHGGKLSGLSVKECTESFKRINSGKTTSFQEFDYANVMTIGGPYTKRGGSVYTDSMLKTLDKRLLETVRAGKMAIVVCHYPYTAYFPNQDKLLAILKSYPNVIYISGHVHYYSASSWFAKVKPYTAKRTPFKRTGIKAAKASYAFRSIGADSVTRNHSVSGTWKSKGQTIGHRLKITDKGKVYYQRYNLKSGEKLKGWKMSQIKGSITVKAKSLTPGSKGKMTYKVVFSDGKKHGGMKSGETFKLKTGKTRTFKGIPAGVLVTVKCVDAPDGWSLPKKARIEVTDKGQKLVMSHTYKQAKRVVPAAQREENATADNEKAGVDGSAAEAQASANAIGVNETAGSDSPASSSTTPDEGNASPDNGETGAGTDAAGASPENETNPEPSGGTANPIASSSEVQTASGTEDATPNTAEQPEPQAPPSNSSE